MEKSIKIWENRLKISKDDDGYMIVDTKLDLFIYMDKLTRSQCDYEKGWLMFYNGSNTYIGSLWISTDTDMKKVKTFLEETK